MPTEIQEHGAALRRLRAGMVASSAIAAHPTHPMDAGYWLDRIAEAEEINRYLHLIGAPEEPVPGRLL